MNIEHEINLAKSTEYIIIMLGDKVGKLSYTHLEYQENDAVQFGELLTVRMLLLFKELGIGDE